MPTRRSIVILSTLTVLAAQLLFSQPEGKAEAAATKHHYRLNFILKETGDGAVINQRSFSLGVAASTVRDAGDRYSLRAGTRIPMANGEKGMNYIDIGTNIDVYDAVEGPDGLQMHVNAEISSPATEPAPSGGVTAFRQVRAGSAVVAHFGKPALVFTADDPASKHKFELDVVVIQSE
jgi:hypothetical protein